MIKDIAFQIFSLAYIIILIVVYLCKRRYHSLENSIYQYLLFFTVIILMLDIMRYSSINFYNDKQGVVTLFCSIYMIGLLIWEAFFMLYFLLIETKNNCQSFGEAWKNSWPIKIWSVLFALFLGGSLAFPVSYNNQIDIYGPYPTNLVYAFGIIHSILVIISLIVNKNKLAPNRRIPLLFIVLVLVAVILIEYFNNNLFLISSGISLVIVFMYIILENPDVKYIGELSKLRENAESANKAKTEFLAKMSHEIRTPMNAIIGLTDAALSNELPYYIKEDIKNINNAGQVLLELINNILDISRIEEGKLELVNNEYNITDIIARIRNIIDIRISEKPIQLTIYIDDNIPKKLYGDETKIFQIILNLLNNSVKYTKKGTIALNISNKRNDDISTLIIKVQDTGIGIKKEDYDKLFEKFARLDLDKNQTIEGTGLGLLITKELINIMNGKITFESTYNVGTEFTVTIPQKIIDHGNIGDIKDSDITPREINYFDGSDYKILVVDDNKLNIKVAERLLMPYKFKVTSVTSGLECLNYTKKNRYDLILLDHMMPEMDGIKTLAALRNRVTEFTTPVVALTANAISGMREMYLESGFDDYLSKPMEPQKLDEVLRKILKIKE